MAEWTWHTGAVNGRCGGCNEVLMPAAMLIDCRDKVWHVECLIDFAVATLPKVERPAMFPWGFVPHP